MDSGPATGLSRRLPLSVGLLGILRAPGKVTSNGVWSVLELPLPRQIHTVLEILKLSVHSDHSL